MKINNMFKTILVIITAMFAACVSYPIGGGGGGGGGSYYTVNFDTQGGDYCNQRNGYYGEEIVLPSTYRAGYTFLGWYSSAYGGINYGLNGDIYTIKSNTTLYARWGSGGYTQVYRIRFDTQGGSYCPEKTANYGDDIILPNTSRSGYSFSGWYSSPNGAGTYYGDAGDIYYRVNSDATLYAYWILGGCTKPLAPNGVSASTLSENSIKISWNANSSANYYELYRSDNSNGQYYWLADVSSLSYTDYDPYFVSGKTYYYKVKAINSCGESAFSNATSATISNGTGELVIKNLSTRYNIKIVTIDGTDYNTPISKGYQRSFHMKPGSYSVEIIDDYGDDHVFSAFASIKAGQITTLIYDGQSFY